MCSGGAAQRTVFLILFPRCKHSDECLQLIVNPTQEFCLIQELRTRPPALQRRKSLLMHLLKSNWILSMSCCHQRLEYAGGKKRKGSLQLQLKVTLRRLQTSQLEICFFFFFFCSVSSPLDFCFDG